MPVDRNDLIDIVGKLRDRAAILRMISFSFADVGGRDTGAALALMSEDIRGDLDVLMDGLENLEVSA